MKRSLHLFVAAVLSFVVATGTAQAGPIQLDQQNTSIGSWLNGGSAAYQWQQGITAGLTGQLTQIELWSGIYGYEYVPSSTELSVYLGAPWQSGQAAWSSLTTLNYGWNTIDLSAASIFVVAGGEFTIGIHGPGGAFDPAIGFSRGDQYQAGELFLNGSTANVGVVGNDLVFRTYVDVCSEFPGGGETEGCYPGGGHDGQFVPDAGSTLLLLGIGLVGLSAWRRRSR